MKRNMLVTMDKLKIDEGIRDLVSQLWKHCYTTIDSCGGHGSQAYILFTSRDGWFENNAHKYGLTKVENSTCCNKGFEDEIRKYGLDPKDFVDRGKTCNCCGAGINGNAVYRGTLVQNPFKSEF